MALEAEQMAVIQLLLVQRQSYADIAAILGVEEPEVRTRARAALTELGDGDPDREVALTDYLLGQGDPIDRADAIRHLRQSPADRDLAERIVTGLREIAPDADLPRLPGESRRPRGSKPSGAGAASGARAALGGRLGSAGRAVRGAGAGLSQTQKRLFAAIGAGAIVLLVAILALTGALGGGSSDSTASSGETTDTTASADAELSGGEDVQTIELTPSGGSDASGSATVGIADGDVPYLDLEIENLSPASNDETYFAWFVLAENRGYPFVPLPIPAGGDFSDRFQIPDEYIPVLENAAAADGGAIEIWLSPNRELGRNIQSAVEERGFVDIPGQRVLSGSLATGGGGNGGGGGSGG